MWTIDLTKSVASPEKRGTYHLRPLHGHVAPYSAS